MCHRSGGGARPRVLAAGTGPRRGPDRPCRRVGGRDLVDLRGTSQILRSFFVMEGGQCLLAPRALSYFPVDLVFVVVPLPSISIRSKSLFIWIVIGMTWSNFSLKKRFFFLASF